MSKKKHKHLSHHAPTPPRPPAAPAAPPALAPRTEPTPEQLARLDAVDGEIANLTAELGPPTPLSGPEPAAATLAEGLRRLDALLAQARGHLERAREREDAARATADRITAQKQESEGAAAARKTALDQAEADLAQRATALATRERAAAAREAEHQAQGAALAERSARLVERELEAGRGFQAEKARVLGPVEAEVTRLREERDQLEVELAARRAEAETEELERAAARRAEWARQDAERTVQEAAERLAFDEAMADERRRALEELRGEIAAARAQAEARWREEQVRRDALLAERDQDLDERAAALARRERDLRGAQLDLAANQELLAEDRAALDRQVERRVAERTETLRHESRALQQQLEDARALRDGYFRNLEARRELDRRFGDRTPEQIMAALAAAERERDALAQQLRDRPDTRAAGRLADLERERSAWLDERAALQGELARATGELATRRLAAIELEALRKQKEALEVHKQLLDGAVDELRARVDELTRQDDRRNPMTALARLDEQVALQAEARTIAPLGPVTPTLRQFAEDLRHRIAAGVEGRTLYYAERDVRAFLGGLAMTRLMLLQGISGTGKTSLPLAFASAVGGGVEIVPVQAGWRDRQDLVGYYNAFHRHYYATSFLQALYTAATPAFRDRLFLMVLDELNLSRPEQFFADFLSALEQPAHDRRLTLVDDPVAGAPRLVTDGRHLPIPPNVWFVGTANHDETTAELADKTYDRAHVMEMPRNTGDARFDVQRKAARTPISYRQLEEAFAAAAAARASELDRATRWLQRAPFAQTLAKRFRVGWGNRLEHQLARYLPVVVEAGGSAGEAMDHLLVTKVLRKLRDRHDVRATALEELNDQIIAAWEELDAANPPERCMTLIQQEIAAKQGEELA